MLNYIRLTKINILWLLQLYGLPLWKSIPPWSRAIPAAVFVVITITSFSFIKDTEGQPFTRLAEVPRIPGIYYFLFLIAWLLIVAIAKVQKTAVAKISTSNESFKNVKDDDKMGTATVIRPSLCKEVFFISMATLTYILCIFLSWILEYIDLPASLFVMSFIHYPTFLVVATIGGSFFLKAAIPLTRSPFDFEDKTRK